MLAETIKTILAHHSEEIDKKNAIIKAREDEIASITQRLQEARVLLAKKGITDQTAGVQVGVEGVGQRTAGNLFTRLKGGKKNVAD